MHFSQVCERIGLAVTPEQFFACYFLEKIGLRFLVDFGLENCIAKAKLLRDRDVTM